MKCKQHPFERGPGVCAPCLRDRLLAILLEEAHSASASAICSPSPSIAAAASSARVLQDYKQQQQYRHHHHYARADSLPSSEPPLVFPRSVSPYVSHRRSVDCGGVGSPFDPRRRRGGGARSLLFYSTPQIGPAAGGRGGIGGAGRRSSKKRWSILSTIFFGRSTNHQRPDARSEPETYSSDPPTGFSNPFSSSSSSSSSWFSWFARSKSKKVNNTSSTPTGSIQYPYPLDAPRTKPHQQRRCRIRHPRGMSPDTSVAAPDDDNNNQDWDDLTSSRQQHSDFSSPSPAWRLPGPTPLRKTPGAGRHMSGFAVCLSPLVWASPGQPRTNQVALDAGCSGELNPGRRGGGGSSFHSRNWHNGSDGAVLGPNRSRKLADLGTFR